MNGNESMLPDGTVQTAVTQKREARPCEVAFAWIAIVAAYLWCRLTPASTRPLGAFLMTLALFIAGGVFLALSGARQNRRSIPCAASTLILSLSFILSSNGFIHFLTLAWVLCCFMLWVLLSYGGGLEKYPGYLLFYDTVKAVFVMPFASFGAIFSSLLPTRTKDDDGARRRGGKQVGFAVIGLLIAVIPTAVVILLLSYDKNFSEIGSKLFKFISGDILDRLLALLFAVPVAAYGFGAFISGIDRKHEKYMSADACRKFSGTVKFAPEVMACFAMLPLLTVYAVFFVSQWNYYVSAFSGKLPEGIDIYSQYARDGFGELCAVSGINAAVMITVSVFTRRRQSDRHSPATRVFIGLLSVSTLILIATAISKMVLYIRAYGLTRLRVYASWFMILLAAGFLIMLIKQIIPKTNAVCAMLAAFILLFGVLALSDPDRQIARYNVDRYIEGTLFLPDKDGIDRLVDECGDSAIPETVRLYTALEGRSDAENTRNAIRSTLSGWLKKDKAEGTDILRTTLPKLLARRAIGTVPEISDTSAGKK